MVARKRLKNWFTEDEKYHNLMAWLKYIHAILIFLGHEQLPQEPYDLADLPDKVNLALSNILVETSGANSATEAPPNILSDVKKQSNSVVETNSSDSNIYNEVKTEAMIAFQDNNDYNETLSGDEKDGKEPLIDTYTSDTANSLTVVVKKDSEGHRTSNGAKLEACDTPGTTSGAQKRKGLPVRRRRNADQMKYVRRKTKITEIPVSNDQIDTKMPPNDLLREKTATKNAKERHTDYASNELCGVELSHISNPNTESVEMSEKKDALFLQPSVPSSKRNYRSKEKRYKCSICHKTFSRRDHCKRHTQIHSKQLKQSGESVIIDEWEGRYSCDVCGKQFAKHRRLMLHMVVHGYKPFICQICNKAFATRSDLKWHQQTHTKPYCCEICGKFFSQKNNLEAHMFVHSGNEFPCSICEKSYKSPVSLKVHIASHTSNDTPVQMNQVCETCGRAFRWHKDLVSHRRTHTGEKPYSCDICGKTFSRRDKLTNHTRTHDGIKAFSCPICLKSFSTPAYLWKHKLTHKAEKRYLCEFCQRLFTRADNLRTHLRIHTGDKPHKCEKCGKAYTQAVSLKHHMRSHARNDYSEI